MCLRFQWGVGGLRAVGTFACVGGKRFTFMRGTGPAVGSTGSTVIEMAVDDVYADSLRVGRNSIPHTMPNVAIKRRVINIIRRMNRRIARIGPNSEMAIGIRACYNRYFCYRRKCMGGYASPRNN